jgi:hypothetical protein
VKLKLPVTEGYTKGVQLHKQKGMLGYERWVNSKESIKLRDATSLLILRLQGRARGWMCGVGISRKEPRLLFRPRLVAKASAIQVIHLKSRP